MELHRINDSPAVVVRRDGAVDTVIGCDVREGRVARFWAIRNPEKLAYLARQLGLGA